MRRRLTPPFVVASVLALLVTPIDAQRNSKDGAGLTVPFSAIGMSPTGPAPVTGTFTITSFASQAGQLVAIGTFAASITENGIPRTGITQLTVPVTAISSGAESSGAVVLQQAPCEILNLVIGPLDLNLLGLVVNLDVVVLNITAVPGSGICSATCCAPLPVCSTRHLLH
jgi:hypothetical protein